MLQKTVTFPPKFKKLDRVISKQFLIAYKKELIKETLPFKQTGRLSKSFVIRKNRIISRLSYTGIQDVGGFISNTEATKKAMWALFYKTGNTKYKNMALSKKSKFKIKGHKFSSKINIKKLMTNVTNQINKMHNV